MKPLALLIAVLVVAFPNYADARLGWTLKECEGKYGPALMSGPTGRNFKGSTIEATFRHEGWQIQVAWFPGSAPILTIFFLTNPERKDWRASPDDLPREKNTPYGVFNFALFFSATC